MDEWDSSLAHILLQGLYESLYCPSCLSLIILLFFSNFYKKLKGNDWIDKVPQS
jgi:hypothetical protein